MLAVAVLKYEINHERDLSFTYLFVSETETDMRIAACNMLLPVCAMTCTMVILQLSVSPSEAQAYHFSQGWLPGGKRSGDMVSTAKYGGGDVTMPSSNRPHAGRVHMTATYRRRSRQKVDHGESVRYFRRGGAGYQLSST